MNVLKKPSFFKNFPLGKAKIIILVFLLLSGIQDALGLGIAPASKVVYFKPGLEENIMVMVINRENKSMDVDVRKEGVLNEYIELDTNKINFKEGESIKSFSYKLRLPSTMEPGDYEGEILITEVVEIGKGETVMAARVEVGSKLKVRVPYPGKHAEAELSVYVNENNVGFAIPVTNIGTEDITARAKIKIFGREEAEIETDGVEIRSLETGTIRANWNATYAGAYKALVEVYYDGNIIELEDKFDVGEKIVEIVDVLFDKIGVGKVAKFNIKVENEWNEIIKDVYADALVKDKEGNEIAKLKTASNDVNAFSNQTLTAYWDTEGVRAGVYDLIVRLNYDGKVSEKSVEVNVEEGKLGITERIVKSKLVRENWIIITLIFVIIILIIVMYYIKRNEKK